MTCCACNGFGCPTCQMETPKRYCDDSPPELCAYWDAGECDGEPRADGGCPYLDSITDWSPDDDRDN